MARTVFVLGAGASREGGAPLMNDFLDVAEELLHQKRVGNAAEHFELVLRARDSLQAVHSKAILNVRNLESVFGAFEMAELESDAERRQQREGRIEQRVGDDVEAPMKIRGPMRSHTVRRCRNGVIRVSSGRRFREFGFEMTRAEGVLGMNAKIKFAVQAPES